MKRKFGAYFENHNFILKKHHEEQKGHSTVITIAVLEKACQRTVGEAN